MVENFIEEAKAFPVNTRFDARASEMQEIVDYCRNGNAEADLVFVAFAVGYMQGHKAAVWEEERRKESESASAET